MESWKATGDRDARRTTCGSTIARHPADPAPHRHGALVLRGGAEFTLSVMDAPTRRDIDDAWPDVLLLLEPGVVVVKEYEHRDAFMGGLGWLERYDLGEDALLFFTHALLHRLVVRSVYVETPLDLSHYAPDVLRSRAAERLQFTLSRPPPSRMPLFNR